MSKRILALVLACLMALALFAGCGNSESAAAPSGGGNTASGDSSGSSGGSAPSGGADDEDTDDEDLVEINLWGLSLFGQDGVKEVEDAVNAISEKEIGVHVNVTVMDMASYAQ